MKKYFLKTITLCFAILLCMCLFGCKEEKQEEQNNPKENLVLAINNLDFTNGYDFEFDINKNEPIKDLKTGLIEDNIINSKIKGYYISPSGLIKDVILYAEISTEYLDKFIQDGEIDDYIEYYYSKIYLNDGKLYSLSSNYYEEIPDTIEYDKYWEVIDLKEYLSNNYLNIEYDKLSLLDFTSFDNSFELLIAIFEHIEFQCDDTNINTIVSNLYINNNINNIIDFIVENKYNSISSLIDAILNNFDIHYSYIEIKNDINKILSNPDSTYNDLLNYLDQKCTQLVGFNVEVLLSEFGTIIKPLICLLFNDFSFNISDELISIVTYGKINEVPQDQSLFSLLKIYLGNKKLSDIYYFYILNCYNYAEVEYDIPYQYRFENLINNIDLIISGTTIEYFVENYLDYEIEYLKEIYFEDFSIKTYIELDGLNFKKLGFDFKISETATNAYTDYIFNMNFKLNLSLSKINSEKIPPEITIKPHINTQEVLLINNINNEYIYEVIDGSYELEDINIYFMSTNTNITDHVPLNKVKIINGDEIIFTFNNDGIGYGSIIFNTKNDTLKISKEFLQHNHELLKSTDFRIVFTFSESLIETGQEAELFVKTLKFEYFNYFD